MALAAAITVLMALLPARLASKDDSKSPTVTCTDENSSKQRTKVTTAGAVLTVECPSSWEIYPPAAQKKVCETAKCDKPVLLTQYAPEAEAEAVVGDKPGIKITFKKLPEKEDPFYLYCRKNDSAACEVEVTLEPATTPPGAGEAPQAPPPSGGGTTSPQICKPNASITLEIPEEGSSALFACEKGYDLYPTEANKIFSKDCKTEESLSDMKRTETTAAETVPGTRSEASKTYTLTANRKPSKKTLCYLCAKEGTTAQQPGPAANYCTIYVESGARTQLDLDVTFILALPCVLAAFQFT